MRRYEDLDDLQQKAIDDLYEHDERLALLETGRTQHEAVRLYEAAGYRPREAFGGYPDNGLSAFYAKRLDLSAQGEAAA